MTVQATPTCDLTDGDLLASYEMAVGFANYYSNLANVNDSCGYDDAAREWTDAAKEFGAEIARRRVLTAS